MPDALDLIIHGNILTMHDARPHAEAVGVKNGRIAIVGDRSDVARQAGKATRRLTLDDRTIIPGFIETHMHPTHAGNVLLNVDLAAAASIEKILGQLAQRIAVTPPGEQILGLNFNYDIVKERRLPTRDELDNLSTAHPIIVLVYDFHSAMLNTRMLEKLDLPESIAGYILDGRGRPTGLIEDPAIARALQQLLPENEREIASAVGAAVKEALSVGITTLHVKEPHAVLKGILKHEQRLPIRIKPMVVSKSPHHEDLSEILQSEIYRHRAAVAFFADGAPDSKTAAFFEPYSSDLTNYGMLYYRDEELEQFIETVHRAGFQVSVHTCGTRATEQVLNIYQKVLSRHPRTDHRHRIEHFEMPLGGQIKKAVDLQLALAMQPMFLYLSGENTYENIRCLLGDERAGRWKPFRSILDAGGLVAGGSDAPVTKMNPVKSIQACILHPNERQRITRYEALRMFTLDAARIGFEEHLKGSIEPGKLADFAVLSANPYSVEAGEVGHIKVLMTIVGGKIEYEA
jgi:predicted amidohydrolase YtcJ